MRTLKLSALSFGVLGALFLATPAFADGYSITGLGTLGGPTSGAFGINNSGQIVGASQNASNITHAFAYSNWGMTDLGTLSGTAVSVAYDINNSGQIVGNTYGGPYMQAFLYSNGTMTNLGSVGGGNAYAIGINSLGQVVGGTDSGAFIYSNGSMSIIAGLSEAAAINDYGQIAGTNNNGHAMLGNNVSLADLGTLGGLTSYANDINSGGLVVGTSDVSGNALHHAFLYRNGSMADLGALWGTNSDALSINANGLVVGRFQVVPGQFAPLDSYRAFVYSNGMMTDLNSLIAADSGWTLESAFATNDSGQIVGTGKFNGQEQAFLLTPNASPVPLPAAAWLFGSGLLGLFGAVRRRKHI